MPYIVKTSAANMPGTCWGVYRRVAVLEVEPGVATVAMISSHASGVVRVVETWERLNVGHTKRCAYQRALTEAEALAAKLNADDVACHAAKA